MTARIKCFACSGVLLAAVVRGEASTDAAVQTAVAGLIDVFAG
jgi:hypothetical protein